MLLQLQELLVEIITYMKKNMAEKVFVLLNSIDTEEYVTNNIEKIYYYSDRHTC